MHKNGLTTAEKIMASIPWLARYPLWRAGEMFRRLTAGDIKRHLIFVVANHFEPAWTPQGVQLGLDTQRRRLDDWHRQARTIGATITDGDGTPFRHTYFYPAEQYHHSLLDTLAQMQAEGLGEVEIHLHHGVEEPDTAANLKRSLEEFRDVLAFNHSLLSRRGVAGQPMYAFVHGNFALANSDGGQYCGVDSEMQILAETGCYADFTLPAAPLRSQVPRINAVYQCGRPLEEGKPHRRGPSLRVGDRPRLPVLFTGPLVFDWRQRRRGLPIPRIEDGMLAANYPLEQARLDHWRGANVAVRGRPDWVFIKLSCHGFFDFDQPTTIGESIKRFLAETIEYGQRSGAFEVYFASAREAFNIAMAAVEGLEGAPSLYRNHWLQLIMSDAGYGRSGAIREQPLLLDGQDYSQAKTRANAR